jgi:hypothetical protein
MYGGETELLYPSACMLCCRGQLDPSHSWQQTLGLSVGMSGELGKSVLSERPQSSQRLHAKCSGADSKLPQRPRKAE